MIGVGMSERALALSMYNTKNPTIIILKLFYLGTQCCTKTTKNDLKML